MRFSKLFSCSLTIAALCLLGGCATIPAEQRTKEIEVYRVVVDRQMVYIEAKDGSTYKALLDASKPASTFAQPGDKLRVTVNQYDANSIEKSERVKK